MVTSQYATSSNEEGEETSAVQGNKMQAFSQPGQFIASLQAICQCVSIACTNVEEL